MKEILGKQPQHHQLHAIVDEKKDSKKKKGPMESNFTG